MDSDYESDGGYDSNGDDEEMVDVTRDAVEEEKQPDWQVNAQHVFSLAELERYVESVNKDPYFIIDQNKTYYQPAPVPSVSFEQIQQLYRSYYHRHSLIRHQIESFDYYMDHVLPAIVREKQRIEVLSKKCRTKHVVTFSDITVCPPMFREENGDIHVVGPMEPIIRKATYCSSILVDVDHKVYDVVWQPGYFARPHPVLQVIEEHAPIWLEPVREKIVQNTPLPQYVNNTVMTNPTMIISDTLIQEVLNLPDFPAELKPLVQNTLGQTVWIEVKSHDVLKSHRVSRQVTLFRQPIMVGSKYCTNRGFDMGVCPFTHGGYFIVNGHERVIVPQEQMRMNHPVITSGKNKRYLYKTEVRSRDEMKIRSTSTINIFISCPKGSNLPTIVVAVPFFQGSNPGNVLLPHIFRLLGIASPSEMRKYILLSHGDLGPHPYDQYIRSILKDDWEKLTLEELREYVSRKGKETTREKKINNMVNVFNKEFLPHIGIEPTPEVWRQKAIYLGMLVFDLLQVYHGDRPCDDRDDFCFKRLNSVCMLFGLQFRQNLSLFLKTFNSHIHKGTENGKYVFALDVMKNSKRITAGLKYAISTGNWGVRKGGSRQVGVSQLLTRMNPISVLNHASRTAINLRQGKSVDPRQLHGSSWGICCTSDSPEGPGCGLVKCLALQQLIRLGSPTSHVLDLIRHCCPQVKMLHRNAQATTEDDWLSCTWLSINGMLFGTIAHDQAEALVQQLRRWRSVGDIAFDTSVVHDKKRHRIALCTDAGCYTRPLFRLEHVHRFHQLYGLYQHNLNLLWEKMVNHGVIEYLDKEEENTMRVAVYWSDLKTPLRVNEMPYTHVEIHPINILGLSVNMIPYPDHNQAPRNTYGSGMIKQGPGKMGLNDEWQCNSTCNTLQYPQKPLVTTQVSVSNHLDEMPNGFMARVAIMCYTGYNQEDSIIVNQAALDCGMGRTLYEKIYREFAKTSGSEIEVLGIPQDQIEPEAMQRLDGQPSSVNKTKIVGLKRADYSKLEVDGFPAIGQEIKENDVIIGKVHKPADATKIHSGDGLIRDKSVIYKHAEPTRIAKVVVTKTREEMYLANVKTRALRIPQMGDKFSSRHGQKGVVSRIMSREDMPFYNRIVRYKKHIDGQWVHHTKQFAIVPWLIINPQAIPSRMTVGQLFEMLIGKVAVRRGQVANGTAFQQYALTEEEKQFHGITEDQPDQRFVLQKKIEYLLHQEGFKRSGKEQFINGMTGEMMEGDVFEGPCFYMRLKHMVEDKVHARSRGSVQILTRQPVEGRSRDGGLRFGEMEGDCAISHGAAAIIQDRLRDCSDKVKIRVCQQCGNIAVPEMTKPNYRQRILREENLPYCTYCRQSDHVVTVVTTCPFSVLVRYMGACHVRMKLEVKPVTDFEVRCDDPPSHVLRVQEDSQQEHFYEAQVVSPPAKKRVRFDSSTITEMEYQPSEFVPEE